LRESLEPSLFEFSRRYCRRSIANAVVQIEPMVVRSPSTTQLDLKRGQAFIRLDETHYDDQGDPIAWSTIDLDDRFIRLEVFRAQ
jgi:DNA-binding GntR family transcriptional regulator